MLKRSRTSLGIVLLLVAIGPGRAQDSVSAELRIGLPGETSEGVVVAPGEGRLRIELPAGASYPDDFEAASGGFLRGAAVRALGDGRVELELRLVRGVLDRIEYRPGSLGLFFSSRFERRTPSADADAYRLGPDDKISLTVYGNEDLDAELTVSKLGTISVELVGEVAAAGLTVSELEARLADMLGEYIVSPQLAISVEEYNSQWVMVAGEVRQPGRYALKGGTRLKEVLTGAQGFSESAGEWITISRRDEDGEQKSDIVVGREEFERGIEDPPLRHGDIVTVGRARYCYVQGEVDAPGRVEVERGMTLLRAISVAGGLTDWASQKDIRIIREGEDGPGKIYNLKKILRGAAEDPPLNGGEVIYVGRRVF